MCCIQSVRIRRLVLRRSTGRTGAASVAKKLCPVSNKHAYPSRKQVLGALHTIQAQHRQGVPDTNATGIYKCPDCREWHLTSTHKGRG